MAGQVARLGRKLESAAGARALALLSAGFAGLPTHAAITKTCAADPKLRRAMKRFLVGVKRLGGSILCDH